MVVGDACNPSTQRQRQGDLYEFEASLVYRVSSRTAKDTQINTILKKKERRKKEKKKRKKEHFHHKTYLFIHSVLTFCTSVLCLCGCLYEVSDHGVTELPRGAGI